MKPATPRWRAFVETRSPSAANGARLALTTITSPGWAMSSALWTIRLSPGYTFTVHAGPKTLMSGSVSGRMFGVIV
jgi:hypothetical protein